MKQIFGRDPDYRFMPTHPGQACGQDRRTRSACDRGRRIPDLGGKIARRDFMPQIRPQHGPSGYTSCNGGGEGMARNAGRGKGRAHCPGARIRCPRTLQSLHRDQRSNPSRRALENSQARIRDSARRRRSRHGGHQLPCFRSLRQDECGCDRQRGGPNRKDYAEPNFPDRRRHQGGRRRAFADVADAAIRDRGFIQR